MTVAPNDIAKAALPQQRIKYGPWLGSMRSKTADLVPRTHMAESDSDAVSNGFNYLPRTGTWKRRGGSSQKFDTFGSAVGLLPAQWAHRCRQLEEFKSDAITDGLPTMCALVTKEDIVTGTDDGRFSNFWVRDQVNSINYTVGSEFSTSTYPTPGTEQSYKVVPLWHKSGEGGITRGAGSTAATAEFQRRLFFGGSRSFLKVGNWWYFPNLNGTPARWNGLYNYTGTLSTTYRATSDTGTAGLAWGKVGGPASFFDCVNDTDADTGGTDYIRFTGGVGGSGDGVEMVIATSGLNYPATGTWQIKLTMRSSDNSNARVVIEFTNAGGSNFLTRTFGFSTNTGQVASEGNVTNSFVEYTLTLTAPEVALINNSGGLFSNNVTVGLSFGGAEGTSTFDWSAISFIVPGAGSFQANRLIPSGPLPPTHAGSLAAGDLIESNTAYTYPNADRTDDSWLRSDTGTNTDLYSVVDEETGDVDAEYISASGVNSTCIIDLATPSVIPDADESVALQVRARRTVAVGGDSGIRFYLYQGSTVIASREVAPLGTAFAYWDLNLTPTQIASITDWTDLRVHLESFDNVGASEAVYVSHVRIAHTALESETDGGWRGSDKFYFSVAYVFEDDSVWMPCLPREPNDILSSGYNLFQVDVSNPTGGFESILWSNIPIGPHGVKARRLLRTPKIDATRDSILQLNLYDLRVVWEIKDNTTTTYRMFNADDDSLVLDPDELLIRFDHRMPPRARYIFGGDSRVCHSYGGENPCAIELAPVGIASDYDKNSADTTDALWNQSSQYFRITASALELTEDSGSALATTSIDITSSDYNTLEKLVDKINASVAGDSGGQWRAQICPGANPQAACATALTPTSRALTSCTVADSDTITRASGLDDVAVGDYIAGTGATFGAYVTAIVSDTELTFSGTITTGTKTLTFYKYTGDQPTGFDNDETIPVAVGYQRVIANSLPGFLYFNSSYLDQFPVEKATVWMTVASPGSVKSAPNCFSSKTDNRHSPPGDPGISMGGFAVDNGFVVPFSKKVCAIRNTRDSGTGLDKDYRIFVINETRGCCAWQSVTPYIRCGFFFTPEGWVCADLFNEDDGISEDIYIHAPTAIGDYAAYEAVASIAATAEDVDDARIAAKVIAGRLWVTYRSDNGHPDRMVCLDLSTAVGSGLERLRRPANDPIAPGARWGWGVPTTRATSACIGISAIGEGRRDDGAHFYGWNEENNGSTGYGRIDELETGSTDNGTAIAASITTPWERMGSSSQLSAQEITVEHKSPSGATVVLDFHRSLSDVTYPMTPSTGTAEYQRDRKMLPLEARVGTTACYIGWRQTAGSASELRSLELKAKSLTGSTK